MANFKGSVSTIDYKLLEAATDNFSKSNVLGEGGSGHVYKACFNDKLLAAVKRIDNGGLDAEREFEVNWSNVDYFLAFRVCEFLLEELSLYNLAEWGELVE